MSHGGVGWVIARFTFFGVFNMDRQRAVAKKIHFTKIWKVRASLVANKSFQGCFLTVFRPGACCILCCQPAFSLTLELYLVCLGASVKEGSLMIR